MIGAVSLDLTATLRKPVPLAAVVERGRRTLADLLGTTTAPDLVVFADRGYRRGVRTDPGRRLGAAELDATVIGGPIPPDGGGPFGSVHFEIDVPATGDGVRLMVIDYHDEGIARYREAAFSPYRTCVGVVVATGLALAAARVADGEYVDEEIAVLTPPVREPDRFVDRTRLTGGSGDFAARCEEYLRQFPALRDWPADRSMLSPDVR